MAVTKGNLMLLMVQVGGDWKTVGATRDHSAEFNQNLIDATTKDTENWEEHVAMLRGLSFSMSGLHDPTKEVGRDEFLTYIMSGEGFKVRYGEVNTGGATIIEADVDIESYSENAPHDGLVSWDLNLKVNGEPDKITNPGT